jgi:hypothetical protein
MASIMHSLRFQVSSWLREYWWYWCVAWGDGLSRLPSRKVGKWKITSITIHNGKLQSINHKLQWY